MIDDDNVLHVETNNFYQFDNLVRKVFVVLPNRQVENTGCPMMKAVINIVRLGNYKFNF